MLGSPILYLKGMRILMFQLSGFYCRVFGPRIALEPFYIVCVEGLQNPNP